MTALAGNVFGLGWGFVIGLIAGTLSAGISVCNRALVQRR